MKGHTLGRKKQEEQGVGADRKDGKMNPNLTTWVSGEDGDVQGCRDAERRLVGRSAQFYTLLDVLKPHKAQCVYLRVSAIGWVRKGQGWRVIDIEGRVGLMGPN